MDDLLPRIKNGDIRTMLAIVRKGKHPREALTDGAFERLVKYIISLEAK